MNKKKLEGGGLLVVQTTQTFSDLCRCLVKINSEGLLFIPIKCHKKSLWNVAVATCGSQPWQQFPCVSVDLQVPIHLCEEIIKCCLPSKVLGLRFSFPLVNEAWEG